MLLADIFNPKVVKYQEELDRSPCVLSQSGYYKAATNPGLWPHTWQPIQFVLIVDNFGIEYVGRQHAHFLQKVLEAHYTITMDWEGKMFSGIDLHCNYASKNTERTCRISMDGYIDKLLIKYNHTRPTKPQLSPHCHREIVYGVKEKLNRAKDTSPALDAAGISPRLL